MGYIVTNGPFIKSKNNKDKILLTNLMMLTPFLIYKFNINGLNGFVIFLVSIMSSLITSFLYNFINDKKNKLNNYYNEVIYSIIISLIVPINVPYLFLFFVNIVIIFLSKYLNITNIYIVACTIICFVMIFTNNKLVFLNYNIYIFSILLIISLFTLINTRSIKFRITIFYLLILIIKIILSKSILDTDYLLLFMSIFVLPEFKSTPNCALIQILFGISIGILSCLFSIEYLLILICVLNIIFKYIDKIYSYYLAK